MDEWKGNRQMPDAIEIALQIREDSDGSIQYFKTVASLTQEPRRQINARGGSRTFQGFQQP